MAVKEPQIFDRYTRVSDGIPQKPSSSLQHRQLSSV